MNKRAKTYRSTAYIYGIDEHGREFREKAPFEWRDLKPGEDPFAGFRKRLPAARRAKRARAA